jgi:hypothetical protein
MISLFIGAGFSKWACDIPLAKELFDFKIDPFGIREYNNTEFVKKLKEQWDIKNPNGSAEMFIETTLKLDLKIQKSVIKYIARRLSESFIWNEYHAGRWRRHVLMIDENRKNNIKGVIRARKFIQSIFPKSSGIITTNYDLLIEYALGSKLFNYGIWNQVLSGRGAYPLSQWRNPVTLKGDLTIAKIHGSISWDLQNKYTDGRRALSGNALIVAPIPEKRPDIRMKEVWSLAKSILNRSSKIIFFGFSFNSYDKAVLKLLKDAKNIKKVLIIDINSTVDKAKEIWPKAKIDFCKPELGFEKLYSDWIKS